MKKELTVSTKEEIIKLHSEIEGHLKLSLQKAIRVSDRTVRRYMVLYENREAIEGCGALSIQEAYKALTVPKTDIVSDLDVSTVFAIWDGALDFCSERLGVVASPENKELYDLIYTVFQQIFQAFFLTRDNEAELSGVLNKGFNIYRDRLKVCDLVEAKIIHDEALKINLEAMEARLLAGRGIGLLHNEN